MKMIDSIQLCMLSAPKHKAVQCLDDSWSYMVSKSYIKFILPIIYVHGQHKWKVFCMDDSMLSQKEMISMIWPAAKKFASCIWPGVKKHNVVWPPIQQILWILWPANFGRLCIWYGKNTFNSALAKFNTLRFFPPRPKYAEIFCERWPKYTHYAFLRFGRT